MKLIFIIRFWDIETETPLKVIESHKNWVLCISFSPNNKYLISGDSAGFISLISIEE